MEKLISEVIYYKGIFSGLNTIVNIKKDKHDCIEKLGCRAYDPFYVEYIRMSGEGLKEYLEGKNPEDIDPKYVIFGLVSVKDPYFFVELSAECFF